MTYEEDRFDLLRHEQEIAAHQSFNYVLLEPHGPASRPPCRTALILAADTT